MGRYEELTYLALLRLLMYDGEWRDETITCGMMNGMYPHLLPRTKDPSSSDACDVSIFVLLIIRLCVV